MGTKKTLKSVERKLVLRGFKNIRFQLSRKFKDHRDFAFLADIDINDAIALTVQKLEDNNISNHAINVLRKLGKVRCVDVRENNNVGVVYLSFPVVEWEISLPYPYFYILTGNVTEFPQLKKCRRLARHLTHAVRLVETSLNDYHLERQKEMADLL